MAISFTCACGKKLAAPETSAGKDVRCPGCGTAARVPNPEAHTVLDWARETHGIPGPLVLSSGMPDGTPTEIEKNVAQTPGVAGRALATLGRYAVLAELGRGGMGEVLLVRDPDLNRELAAKVIRGGSAQRPLVEKFLLEAQVTGQLEHPNIVPVHELGLAPGGQAFFTMKRVQGKDLGAILGKLREESGRASSSASSRRRRARPEAPRGPGVSLPRLLEIFLKVCDAISFAHSRGVIHRDLKPANVMTGEFGEVLVMDWGLCRARNLERGKGNEEQGTRMRGSIDPSLTAEGAVMGTPAYMPPEQATGAVEKVDERSDIYSLGAILYELLALVPPFSGSSAAAILQKVEEGKLVPPSRRAGGRIVPRELEAAVLKAMAFERENRYQSVAELRADIEAYLSGRTLAAAEYSPWQVLAKWARRKRAVVLGTAAAILALAAGLAAMAVAGRAAKAREATDLHAQGELEWEGAREKYPFNRAAPQDYFQHHVAALMKMGRAHEIHPSPPRDWGEEIAARSSEIQERAEESGDWAMAQVLARSAGDWGAVGDGEVEARLARVQAAIENAEKEDRERLERHLDAISLEEGEKQGKLLPGEIEERAIRLARGTRPSFTKTLLALIEQGEIHGQGRRLLVETLARKGDTWTDHAGLRAPELVRRELARARTQAEAWRAGMGREGEGPKGAADPQARPEETAGWLRAAARIEARSPQTFPDLADLLEETSRAFGDVGPVVEAARWGKGAASDPEEAADIRATRVRSGSRYTRFLLDLATRGALESRPLAAVIEALGLASDPLPPDPTRPEIAAIPVVRELFDRTWATLADRTRPRADRNGARQVTIAAANALSRLGDGDFARTLHERRFKAQDVLGDAGFMTRTALAFRLLEFSWEEPTTATAYKNRGNARRDQGDLVGAVADFTRAIELDPNFDIAYNNRGLARRDQGDLAGAVADFTRAIELDPSFAEAYSNRGGTRREQGNLAGAMADSTRAIELDPNCAMAYGNRGNARHDQGDLSGAVADYTRAIELDPNEGWVYNNRGVARRDQGDLAGAVADYACAIELDPNDAMAYNNRGNALRDQGDLAGALADYTRAIELDSTYAEAYSNRGVARKGQGDLTGAVADFTRAIEIDPSSAEAYTNRGLTRHDQSDLAGAEADFTRATDLAPGLWQAWTGRGIALAGLGRMDEAAASFERALALAPPSMKPQVEATRRQSMGR